MSGWPITILFIPVETPLYQNYIAAILGISNIRKSRIPTSQGILSQRTVLQSHLWLVRCTQRWRWPRRSGMCRGKPLYVRYVAPNKKRRGAPVGSGREMQHIMVKNRLVLNTIFNLFWLLYHKNTNKVVIQRRVVVQEQRGRGTSLSGLNPGRLCNLCISFQRSRGADMRLWWRLSIFRAWTAETHKLLLYVTWALKWGSFRNPRF